MEAIICTFFFFPEKEVITNASGFGVARSCAIYKHCCFSGRGTRHQADDLNLLGCSGDVPVPGEHGARQHRYTQHTVHTHNTHTLLPIAPTAVFAARHATADRVRRSGSCANTQGKGNKEPLPLATPKLQTTKQRHEMPSDQATIIQRLKTSPGFWPTTSFTRFPVLLHGSPLSLPISSALCTGFCFPVITQGPKSPLSRIPRRSLLRSSQACPCNAP